MLKCSSVVGDGTLTKFNIIQDFIVVILICKNEEDQFKMETTRVVTTDLLLLVYGDFFRRSRAAYSTVQGSRPNFEPIRDVMVVIVTCKNEEDPIKMKALQWSQH